MSTIQWTILLHLSGFAGFFFPGIGNWAAPLVIWLIKKTDSPEIDRVGKEVLNFQLSYTLYSIVGGIIIGVLTLVVIGVFPLPLLGILWLMWVIFMILAAIKASNGETYTYPLTIRFLN